LIESLFKQRSTIARLQSGPLAQEDLPAGVLERAIANCSRKGDRIAGWGLGSTLLACERSGRVARLIERSPINRSLLQRLGNWCKSRIAAVGHGRRASPKDYATRVAQSC
jgi:hypothetical protein